MMRYRLALITGLIVPTIANAQTANGSPTSPASVGLIGTPRPISRTAPSVGAQRTNPALTFPADITKPAPKLTAAEMAEKRKLDHDLKICIGC